MGQTFIQRFCFCVQKLSVRSVQGQTYCARTGTKLTGQITESFIITDWTEVLTGSFRYSQSTRYGLLTVKPFKTSQSVEGGEP